MGVVFVDEELWPYIKEHKIQSFRVKQIFQELYKNQNIFWDEMTTLPNDLKQQLSQDFSVIDLDIENIIETSETTKFAFKTHDWYTIEAVLMYHRSKHFENKLNRITLCLSSQIWCPMWCAFCVTWKLWLIRNLEWTEIVSQMLFVNHYIKEKFGKKEDGTLRSVRNVVFMWMGEPLLNYDNVKKAIEIMFRQDRFSLSRRHVTISTVWVIPWIQKLIDDNMESMLAVSLHAPTQTLRETILPSAKMYPLPKLMDILKKYEKKTWNRLFYEYIMISWVTDWEDNAKELIKLLKGQNCHVNLIPYNENPVVNFKESSLDAINSFKSILEKWGLTVTIRDSMWRESKWACGQLWYEKLIKSN